MKTILQIAGASLLIRLVLLGILLLYLNAAAASVKYLDVCVLGQFSSCITDAIADLTALCYHFSYVSSS